MLYEGRAGGLDQAVVGAQAQGFNSETAGIASIGDHTSAEPTPETLSTLARYIRWKLQVHGQPLSGPVTLTSAGGSASRYGAGARVTVERVIGHRDTGRTACPGALLYAQLDELRAMVASGAGAPTTDHGAPERDAGRLRGRLRRPRCRSPGCSRGPTGWRWPARPVEVQVNGDGPWVTAQRLLTAADGTFATELRPRQRLYVRLRFPGQAELRRSDLLAAAAAAAPGGRAAPARPPRPARGARVRIAGTVGPRKRLVHLVLQQRIRGRFRTVGVRARAGPRAGSFKQLVRARPSGRCTATRWWRSRTRTRTAALGGWRTLRVR